MTKRGWHLCETWRKATWYKTKSQAVAALRDWRLKLEARDWTKAFGRAGEGYVMIAPGADYHQEMLRVAEDKPPKLMQACYLKPADAPLHPKTKIAPTAEAVGGSSS